MPTLSIAGRDVEVGEAFLTLSPEEQTRTVDDIIAEIGLDAGSAQSDVATTSGGIAADDPRMGYIQAAKDRVARGERFAPSPGHREFDPKTGESNPIYGGSALNTTAGLASGMYGLPGVLVDAAAGGMNLGIRGYNAATGENVPTIDDPFLGSAHLQRMIGGTLGEIDPVLDPRNTQAVTTGDKILRGAGEAAGGSLAGAGVVGGLSRMGALTGPASTTAANVLGRSDTAGIVAGEALISGASGAGASAASEAAPDEWKPLASLAGGLAGGVGMVTIGAGVPALGRAGARAAADQTAVFREAGRQRMVSMPTEFSSEVPK